MQAMTTLRKRLWGKESKRHTWQEKLHVLWHMEVSQVSRRRAPEIFGIARSTYYRWLRQAQDGTLAGQKAKGMVPPNKTPDPLAVNMHTPI